MKNLKQLLCIPTAAILLAALPGKTDAAELSLKVKPSLIFISTESARLSKTITLTNPTHYPLSLSLQKKQFSANTYGELKIKDPDATHQTLFAKNIILRDNDGVVDTLILQPLASKNITIDIKRSDINKEDLQFGILTTTENTPRQTTISDKNIVAYSQNNIGTFIPIVISYPIGDDQVKLSSFTSDLFTLSSSPTFSITLSNPTKHATRIKTSLKVVDILGEETEVSKESKMLLKESKQHITTSGVSNTALQKKLLLGPYKATLTVSDNKTKIEKSIYIFVVRVKEVLILLSSLVLLIIISQRVKKNKNKL
jgi:hypothetical protein